MMIKRLAALLVGLAAAQSAFAADDLPAWLTERRIIGNNDLEPIEATIGTDAYDKARIVARVEGSDGSGFCTGSRLSQDLFLTNYHCYEYKPCEELQFHLGYERDLSRGRQLIFKCSEVLAKNENLDYAIYRVELVGPLPDGETATHDFPNLALPIPDNDQTGVEKSFEIAQEGNILDLKVTLKVTHPWIGDLRIALTGPDGTSVSLHDGAGGDTDNIARTYGLEDGLSAFSGKAAAGTWKLTLKDLAASDAGQLESVSFQITAASGDGDAQSGTDDYPFATLWAGAIAVDQPLIVASHPAARLKEIDRSATCVLRTIETEVVAERTTITHTCDTEGGSSGSPVLDRETGHIVALHWGGTFEYNLAIPMGLIVKDLEEKLSPEAYGQLSIQR